MPPGNDEVRVQERMANDYHQKYNKHVSGNKEGLRPSKPFRASYFLQFLHPISPLCVSDKGGYFSSLLTEGRHEVALQGCFQFVAETSRNALQVPLLEIGGFFSSYRISLLV